MEVLGIPWEWKNKGRYKERVPEKKPVVMVQVEDPAHILYDKPIYYLRPDNQGKNFYHLSGGWSKLCEFDDIKMFVNRGDVYVRKENEDYK